MLIAPRGIAMPSAPAKAIAMPAPVGGWDTESAWADMPPHHAVEMVNWVPYPDYVETRGGYTPHVTGFADPVESLMSYSPPAGGWKLIAAAGDKWFDATTAGPISTPLLTGMTSARWQYVQMTTAGGHFLIAANGQDAARRYDGTSVTLAGINGPDPTKLVWLNLHQRRLWCGETGSLKAWYLAPNAIQGAATAFDLAPLASLGGYLVGMGTWTRDGGSGPDDYAAFVTSEGQVLIYAGTDPASASTWGLVGVFRIGRPLGRRCMLRFGADLVVLTEDGVVALSQVLPVDRAQQSAAAVSAQVNKAFSDAARSYGTSWGWDAFVYPGRNLVIFNVPWGASAFRQYVFSTLTRAPAQWRGVPARCWALADGVPYFGGSAAVYRFDDGGNDDGEDIDAWAIQAWHGFQHRAQKVMFRRAAPVLRVAEKVSFAIDVLRDYRIDVAFPDLVPLYEGSDAYWDSALWDQSTWNDHIVVSEWRGVHGIGRVGAIRLRLKTKHKRVAWMATNVLTVPGGTL